jgi:hypothetical protein
MEFKEVGESIFYIEDVFPKHKEFLDLLENENTNEKIHPVIPAWNVWHEYAPENIDGKFVDTINKDIKSNGFKKHIDWDHTSSYKNWPRLKTTSETSEAHKLAEPIIQLFEPFFKELLNEWCKINNKEGFDYITRNYCIKKYIQGGKLGTHIDRNIDNPTDTQDWTVLFYLNDDYDGGEVSFLDKRQREITLIPKAGSALIFSTDTPHWVNEIKNGNKYFMFFYIHSTHKTCVSIDEKFFDMHVQKAYRFYIETLKTLPQNSIIGAAAFNNLNRIKANCLTIKRNK